MTHNRPEDDEYLQDAGYQSDKTRRVVAYGADRHSNQFYLALLVGVALALGIALYAVGMFNASKEKTANNPVFDKLPTTTGQNSESR